MFRAHIHCGIVLALTSVAAESAADETISLAVPGIQCQRCVESLSSTLGKADASVKVVAALETKQLEVTYDPAKISLYQIVAMVSEAPPVHNKPYEAGVLVTVEDPVKNSAKLKKALGQIKGIMNLIPMPGGTPESSDFMIVLRPLPRNAKPTEFVHASDIGQVLEKNGIRFSGLPAGDDRGALDSPDAKKKIGTPKSTSKSKMGVDSKPGSKVARSTPSSSKTKSSARDSIGTQSKSRDKESESEDRPRFAILAGDSDKVFLVDHEAKADDGKQLKRLVKQGDRFGDYIVKEVGDDDGLYVVLEHAESKERIRVEHKKKESEGKSRGQSEAGSKDPQETTKH